MIRSSDHPVIRPSSCWGITPGAAGMEAQVRALAEALGLSCEMKTAQLRTPFLALPSVAYTGGLGRFIVPHLLDPNSDDLSGPLPDVVISCGRRAAAVAMGLRRWAVGRGQSARFIHIQDPYVDPKHFDLVIAMAHDRITGANVIKTRFALHRITHAALKEAREAFSPQFSAYPAPYTAVLIGGSTNKYALTEVRMREVVETLQRVLAHAPGALLMTASRRTGAANIAQLQEAFVGNPRVYLYDFVGENPYMGVLALADSIIVTNDSVNMMSEAQATGKPLYIMPLPGHEGTKPARFAEALVADGLARMLGDTIERWEAPTGDTMAQLAAQVRAHFG